MRAVLLVALVPALALPPSGCGGAGDGTCNQDFDCASAEVCANNFACRDADWVYAVTVAWTLSGQPASADSCALIDHL